MLPLLSISILPLIFRSFYATKTDHFSRLFWGDEFPFEGCKAISQKLHPFTGSVRIYHYAHRAISPDLRWVNDSDADVTKFISVIPPRRFDPSSSLPLQKAIAPHSYKIHDDALGKHRHGHCAMPTSIFVDDFLALAQGSPAERLNTKRTVLHVLDSVLLCSPFV